MNIAVIGTGYVGLVTGTCLAETGNNVICVDVNRDKVEEMKRGIIPIYEPGLENLFLRNIKNGRLSFTTNLADAIEFSKIIFLALPTPPKDDGSADLSYIVQASEAIARLISEHKIVINKSTVPVGTADLTNSIFKAFSNQDVDVVSNPEFLREGVAVEDFMKPDRIVIGTESLHARKVLKELYEPYVRQGNPIIFMDRRSAEVTKYAANSFLAAKISFMNEIANLCETVEANVDDVRLGMGSDHRIGNQFLYPGIGYGGSCFPKDVRALEQIGLKNGLEMPILNVITRVNNNQKTILVDKMLKYYGGSLTGKHFAIWGLAFKPETDDIREAPAIDIIIRLLNNGATVSLYDPVAMENTKKQLGPNAVGIIYAEDKYDATVNADALIIATEWSEFRTPDFEKLSKLMKSKRIFDGRNLFNVHNKNLRSLGFYYQSIGRNIRSEQ